MYHLKEISSCHINCCVTSNVYHVKLVVGLYELTHDNLTEHLHTVNLLARFNIYQEVFLAVLYRTLPFLQVTRCSNGYCFIIKFYFRQDVVHIYIYIKYNYKI